MIDQHAHHPQHDEGHDVIVVGAGIAGLSAALTATAAGRRVLVLDAHPIGGRARTTETDGFQLNVGPHALFGQGHLANLLARHGVAVSGATPPTATVWFLRDGALHPLEVRAGGIARTKLLGVRSRARFLALLARIPSLDAARFAGRSVAEWLGDEPDDVVGLALAFVRVSTYVDDPARFDAGAAIAQLQLARAGGVRYLDGGWGRMVARMAGAALAGGAGIVPGLAATRVEAVDGGVSVVTSDGREVRGGAAIVAAGGPELAERLTGATVAGRAGLTEPVEAASLDLALARPSDVFALGVERSLYLSPHAPVARLAPEGRGLVTAMRYGRPGTPMGEPRAVRAELRDLATLAGIADGDVLHERYLHRSVVTHGAPTAAAGGLAGRPGVDALGLPGVLLAGDWVGRVGLLADASAASGEAAAVAALAALAGGRAAPVAARA